VIFFVCWCAIKLKNILSLVTNSPGGRREDVIAERSIEWTRTGGRRRRPSSRSRQRDSGSDGRRARQIGIRDAARTERVDEREKERDRGRREGTKENEVIEDRARS
jgi:hypothetical protein